MRIKQKNDGKPFFSIHIQGGFNDCNICVIDTDLEEEQFKYLTTEGLLLFYKLLTFDVDSSNEMEMMKFDEELNQYGIYLPHHESEWIADIDYIEITYNNSKGCFVIELELGDTTNQNDFHYDKFVEILKASKVVD